MPNTIEILTNAGLNPSDAEIYDILVQNGEMTVPRIQEKTSLSRASIYDSLNNLLAKDYIEYRKEGRNAFYRPNHPNKLFGLIEEKKQNLVVFSQEMEEAIRQMTGAFNLANNKPGVRFFEGGEGLKEALYHSLEENQPIYTFVDSRTVEKYAKSIDEKYVYERIKRGIKKQIIMTDSVGSKQYLKGMHKQLTEAKLIDPKDYPFEIAVEIYGDNVSYLSITDKQQNAFVIKNKNIADFHKSMFNFIWNKLPKIKDVE